MASSVREKRKGAVAPQKRLRIILHHHVALGVEAIFSCFFTAKNPKRVAFHHVLNRIMVVAQAPIMFVVLRNLEGETPSFYISNKHKNDGHQKRIRKRIGEVLSEKEERTKYLIPLWHDIGSGNVPEWLANTTCEKKYFLLVLEAHSEDYDFEKLPRFRQLEAVRSPVDAAMYCIEKIFSPNKYLHYGEGFFRNLAGSLDTITFCDSLEPRPEDCVNTTITDDEFWSEFLGKTSPPAALKRLKKTRESCKKIFREEGTPYALDGESVLDRTFSNLKGSIDSLSSGATITNCLLFTRSYDRPIAKPRFGLEYDYNVRISRGIEQSREHFEAFERWVTLEKDKKEEGFVLNFPDGETLDDQRARLILHEALSEFWNKIETKNGREDLQAILHDDFGDDARSVSEPVFEGTSFFRDPFIRLAGLERCFPNGIPPGATFLELPERVQKDVFRVIAFNFLLQDMAPERNGNPPALASGKRHEASRVYVMLNPVELGGKVWAVAAYAARTARVDRAFDWTVHGEGGASSPPSDIEVRNRIERWNGYWLTNFHTYQDVHERLKRSLRQHLKTAYYELLGRTYSESIWFLHSETTTEVVQTTINNALREFTCFFPYSEVSITIEHDSKRLQPVPYRPSIDDVSKTQGKENHALFAEHVAAKIDVRPNMRYPDAPGRDQGRAFVTQPGLAVAFTDAVFRQSALQGSKKNA